MPNIATRMFDVFINNYTYVEAWSVDLELKELKAYLNETVFPGLKKDIEGLDILLMEKGICETIICRMPMFDGYIIYVSKNVDLQELKESCMQYEFIGGKRMLDIDVYERVKSGKYRKISRKN